MNKMVKENLEEKVKAALKEIQPMIESHGGGIEVVSVKDGKVVIKILGACLGCPMAAATFGQGMEEMIKEKVPQIKKIEFQT